MTILMLGGLTMSVLAIASFMESHPWKPPSLIAYLDACDAVIDAAEVLVRGLQEEDHTYGGC